MATRRPRHGAPPQTSTGPRQRRSQRLSVEPPAFQWPVPMKGYVLQPSTDYDIVYDDLDQQERDRYEWYLVEAVEAEEEGTSYWSKRPLTDSGLFRTFAAVVPRPQPIRDFANRYGLLGHPRQIEEAGRDRRHGEPVVAWVEEIGAMRQAVNLWEIARGGDRHSLARYVRVVDGDKLVCSLDPIDPSPEAMYDLVVATASTDPGLLAQARMGFLKLPALYAAISVVNDHVRAETLVEIGIRPPRPKRPVAGNPSVALTVAPRTLRGALWLQLADAIVSDKTFRQCERCGTWFELTPKMAAKGKLFCGTSCRMRDYRERQEQARQLWIKRTPLKEIAAAVRSDVPTVKSWIGSVGKRSSED